MAIQVELPVFVRSDTDELATVFYHAPDLAGLGEMWRYFLAMAVRDRAARVHWHPWEAGHALSYTEGGKRYTLVRPDESLDAVTFEAARRLISPGLRGYLARRFLRSGSGRLFCESEFGPSVWCGVWWADREHCGVEFVRLDYFTYSEPPTD